MFYHPVKTNPEVIGEVVDYNVGLTNELSVEAEDVLELITRPPSDQETFSYVLGRVDYIRVPLRGQNQINIKDVVEDCINPDAIYRIPVKP